MVVIEETRGCITPPKSEYERPIKWASALLRKCKQQKAVRLQRRMPKEVLSKYIAVEESVSGYHVLRRLKQGLRKFDKYDPESERSVFQKDLHTAFVRACIQKIFGRFFWQEAWRIMEIEGIKGQIRREICALAPRRFGKTMAVAMFLAAFLANVPGPYTIIVFSPGRRASWMLRNLVHVFLTTVFDKSQHIKKSNVETIEVHGGLHVTDVRTLHAYPQKVRHNFFLSLSLCACVCDRQLLSKQQV
jgi:hypothetical protein